jgi:hypothetical protein
MLAITYGLALDLKGPPSEHKNCFPLTVQNFISPQTQFKVSVAERNSTRESRSSSLLFNSVNGDTHFFCAFLFLRPSQEELQGPVQAGVLGCTPV